MTYWMTLTIGNTTLSLKEIVLSNTASRHLISPSTKTLSALFHAFIDYVDINADTRTWRGTSFLPFVWSWELGGPTI